jgi:hypothetical protein
MSQTPPSKPSPLPHSTPIHTHSSTTGKYNPKYEGRDATSKRIANEMTHFFVGPMPPQDFLNQFLSPPLYTSNHVFKMEMFSGLSGITPENAMYNKFVCFRSYLPSLA